MTQKIDQNIINNHDIIVNIIIENKQLFLDEIDNEIPNWVNQDFMDEDGYDDENDYYNDHSNGEAGDAVYISIIKPLFDAVLTEQEIDLIDDVYNIYNLLNEHLDTQEFK